MKIRRIGILTGGGDAPGLNAVIRAAVRASQERNWQAVGLEKGFEALLHPGLTRPLELADVAGILTLGGTILGTTNKGDPFRDGNPKMLRKAVRRFRQLKLDALVAIGGDGTLGIALKLFRAGIPVVGVPKTIDNDLSGTVITFGFDTAVSTATEAIDKLHSTAASHERIMVVEVMGRYAGWIALHAGVGGGAEAILIPEIPFDLKLVARRIRKRYAEGRRFAIVVAAEGAAPKDGKMLVRDQEEKGREHPHLGGVAEFAAKELQRLTGFEARSLVLGHLQRGGHPTTFDRLLATRFGVAAIHLVEEGKFGRMVALHPPNIASVSLEEAVGQPHRVPLNSDILAAARSLGITFGA